LAHQTPREIRTRCPPPLAPRTARPAAAEVNPMRHTLPALLLFLASTVQAAEPFSAKVIGISDGDTLTVLKADKTQVKIRLHGIDCPDTGQDFATRAKEFTSSLVFEKTVRVNPLNTDRYGHTVAEVFLPDGRMLNCELVSAGFAWWYRQYAPDDKLLELLEKTAKFYERGLWADPKPNPPWEWRKIAGPPVDATGKVIADRIRKIFHKPGCSNGVKILERNRVLFESEAEAEKAGYRPGFDCHKSA
jgi:micrococcal nuclease